MESSDVSEINDERITALTTIHSMLDVASSESEQEHKSDYVLAPNDKFNQTKHSNHNLRDAEDLKLHIESSKRFGLTELFNRAISAFVTDGTFRKKGWNIWNKNNNDVTEQKYSHVIASSTALIQQIRPPTLPAKDVFEESRHKAEYDNILRDARLKEQRLQYARQNELKNQVKREEAQARRVKQWQDILPKFSKLKNHQYVRSLWWHGLPPCVRGRIWCLAFGNDLKLTYEDYYSHVCKAGIKIALNLGFSMEDIIKINKDVPEDKIYQLFAASNITNHNGLNNEESKKSKIESKNSQRNSDSINSNENGSDTCLNVIQLDISRTFPSLGVFQKGCPYYPILHALLAAYVTYKPHIGYVQGMSFIAAVLLLNMEPPDAFIAFCNILEKPLHAAAFSLDQREMEAYFRAYDDLLCHCLPVLHAHFTALGLSAELYCVDWLYSIYSRAMPFDVACRVWDLFARDGEEALFQTAIGILAYFQSSLLKMDFITAAQFLTRLPENINQDTLFRSIRKAPMKIGQTSFVKLLSSYKGHV